MKLELFNFNGSEIRVVIDDSGDHWFVAADVCRTLEIQNATNAVASVDQDDLSTVKVIDSLGRQQSANAVNESGLYALIFASRKNEAKAFKKWVTSEVLPAIRKTGQYKTEAHTLPGTFAEALRAYALEVEKSEALAIENATLKPKAEFYDAVANCERTDEFADVCKMIPGCPGRTTLMDNLRRLGILRKNNTPYQEYVDRGYFKVVESRWTHPRTGETQITLATRVFQRGIDYIRKLVQEGKLTAELKEAA